MLPSSRKLCQSLDVCAPLVFWYFLLILDVSCLLSSTLRGADLWSPGHIVQNVQPESFCGKNTGGQEKHKYCLETSLDHQTAARATGASARSQLHLLSTLCGCPSSPSHCSDCFETDDGWNILSCSGVQQQRRQVCEFYLLCFARKVKHSWG